MPTWDDVRQIGLAFPETEESTSYGLPALKVRGKPFVQLSTHEEGALVLRVEPEEQAPLVAAQPNFYFLVPHYEGYGAILVRLETADPAELAAAIEDSYALVESRTPKRTRPKPG